MNFAGPGRRGLYLTPPPDDVVGGGSGGDRGELRDSPAPPHYPLYWFFSEIVHSSSDTLSEGWVVRPD